MMGYSHAPPGWHAGPLPAHLYQCPACLRVEQRILLDPRCWGTPGNQHAPRAARKVTGLAVTDRRRLFG
jgi:hypothetical protein